MALSFSQYLQVFVESNILLEFYERHLCSDQYLVNVEQFLLLIKTEKIINLNEYERFYTQLKSFILKMFTLRK